MRFIQNICKNEEGVSAVEMALCSALLAVMIPAFIDLSNLLEARSRLAGSIRAGEQYALRMPDDLTGIENAVRNANSLGSGEQLSVDATQSCECSGYPAVCGTTCSGGGSPAKYVTISSSYGFDTNYSYAPLLGTEISTSRSMTIRVQ